MHISANEAIVKANKLVKKYGTRNADRLANELGVIVNANHAHTAPLARSFSTTVTEK